MFAAKANQQVVIEQPQVSISPDNKLQVEGDLVLAEESRVTFDKQANSASSADVEVRGCAVLLGTVVVQVDVDAVANGGRVELVTQQCDNATAIEESNKAEIEVVDKEPSCRKATASTEATASGIVALLTVDDSDCDNNKRNKLLVIILSVAVPVVVLAIAAVVIFALRARAKRKVHYAMQSN